MEIITVGISLKQSFFISRFVSSTQDQIRRIEMCLSADFGVEPVGLTDLRIVRTCKDSCRFLRELGKDFIVK